MEYIFMYLGLWLVRLLRFWWVWLPIVTYFVWRWSVRRERLQICGPAKPDGSATGAATDAANAPETCVEVDITDASRYRATVRTVVVMVALILTLVGLALGLAPAERGNYIPAYMDNGTLVPGRVVADD